LPLRLFDVELGQLPILEQGVLFGVVPVGHQLLELNLVVLWPESPHRFPHLEQQVEGAADREQVEVAQQHLLPPQLLVGQRRVDVILRPSVLPRDRPVLELGHHPLQGVEHFILTHLVR
jgi:hypothetical protein